MRLMGEKEISLDLAELGRMELYCKCGVGFLIDWDKERPFPQICYACGHDISDLAKSAMAAYQRFYQQAKDSGLKFKFRVAAT